MTEMELKRLGKSELIRLVTEASASKDGLSRQLEDTKRQLADAQDQKKELKRQLHSCEERLSDVLAELRTAREDLAAARSGSMMAERLAGSLREQLVDAQTALTETQTALLIAGESLRTSEAELKSAREQMTELNGQIAGQKKRLEEREIAIGSAGSLAEATAGLNGIFEAAQNTARQYLENIERRMKKQEAECAEIESNSRAEADRLIRETADQCGQMMKDAEAECEKMKYLAAEETRRKWSGLSEQLQMISREIASTAGGPEKK